MTLPSNCFDSSCESGTYRQSFSRSRYYLATTDHPNSSLAPLTCACYPQAAEGARHAPEGGWGLGCTPQVWPLLHSLKLPWLTAGGARVLLVHALCPGGHPHRYFPLYGAELCALRSNSSLLPSRLPRTSVLRALRPIRNPPHPCRGPSRCRASLSRRLGPGRRQ